MLWPTTYTPTHNHIHISTHTPHTLHTYTHTSPHTQTHTRTHIYIHIYIHTQTCLHTCTHSCSHTRTHTHRYTLTSTYSLILTHTHFLTLTHTDKHTLTHVDKKTVNAEAFIQSHKKNMFSPTSLLLSLHLTDFLLFLITPQDQQKRSRSSRTEAEELWLQVLPYHGLWYCQMYVFSPEIWGLRNGS